MSKQKRKFYKRAIKSIGKAILRSEEADRIGFYSWKMLKNKKFRKHCGDEMREVLGKKGQVMITDEYKGYTLFSFSLKIWYKEWAKSNLPIKKVLRDFASDVVDSASKKLRALDKEWEDERSLCDEENEAASEETEFNEHGCPISCPSIEDFPHCYCGNAHIDDNSDDDEECCCDECEGCWREELCDSNKNGEEHADGGANGDGDGDGSNQSPDIHTWLADNQKGGAPALDGETPSAKNDTPVACPKCGSTSVRKDGHGTKNGQRFQKYICKSCKKYFSELSIRSEEQEG